MHSCVLQATNAFLGMLPLCLVYLKYSATLCQLMWRCTSWLLVVPLFDLSFSTWDPVVLWKRRSGPTWPEQPVTTTICCSDFRQSLVSAYTALWISSWHQIPNQVWFILSNSGFMENTVRTGVALVVEWLSSWILEQGVRVQARVSPLGFQRLVMSPASKSQYDWKIVKAT